jgi:hypothetical protein
VVSFSWHPADVEVHPNPNEVKDYKYFSFEELKQFIDDSEKNVRLLFLLAARDNSLILFFINAGDQAHSVVQVDCQKLLVQMVA